MEARVEFTSEEWAEYAEEVGKRTTWEKEHRERRSSQEPDCQQLLVRCSTEAECLDSGSFIWTCESWDELENVDVGILANGAQSDASTRKEPAFQGEWEQWRTEMRRYAPDGRALAQLIAKHDGLYNTTAADFCREFGRGSEV